MSHKSKHHRIQTCIKKAGLLFPNWHMQKAQEQMALGHQSRKGEGCIGGSPTCTTS